jgi:hypothetical protein
MPARSTIGPSCTTRRCIPNWKQRHDTAAEPIHHARAKSVFVPRPPWVDLPLAAFVVAFDLVLLRLCYWWKTPTFSLTTSLLDSCVVVKAAVDQRLPRQFPFPLDPMEPTDSHSWWTKSMTSTIQAWSKYLPYWQCRYSPPSLEWWWWEVTEDDFREGGFHQDLLLVVSTDEGACGDDGSTLLDSLTGCFTVITASSSFGGSCDGVPFSAAVSFGVLSGVARLCGCGCIIGSSRFSILHFLLNFLFHSRCCILHGRSHFPPRITLFQ